LTVNAHGTPLRENRRHEARVMTFSRNLALIVAGAVLALSACARTPNDVSPSVQGRQGGLNGQISATPIGPTAAPTAAGGLPVNSGASGTVTFLDPNSIEAIASGAIAEAEGAGGTTGGVFDNIQPQQASDLLPAPLIPRVAAFALRTTHQPGQRQWRRNPLRRSGTELCSQFPSRDLAQDRFLAEGGPERDPLGLDPDGDGFVCGFDPAPVRAEAAAPAISFDNLPTIDG